MDEVRVSGPDVDTIRYVPDEGGPARPFYDRVKREIANRGWTWTRLCEETGVARSTFNSWKSQPRPPQAVHVNTVARILGIPRDEAHKLAGFYDDGGGDLSDLTAECPFESRVLSGPAAAGAKRAVILGHREEGHSDGCRATASPLTPRQQAILDAFMQVVDETAAQRKVS